MLACADGDSLRISVMYVQGLMVGFILFVLVRWTVSKVNARLMFLILGETPRGETFDFLRRKPRTKINKQTNDPHKSLCACVNI